MGMSWYFALSESSIERDEHDWRGLIRVAVKSAHRHTQLQPILLYDGQPGEFTADLENLGVRIVYHRVSFFDDLARHAEALGQPWWLSIASGAFLRTEIPLLHGDTRPVLYTDCDVMFTRDPGILQCGRAPFAVVPEHTKRVRGKTEDMNSGVMIMNIESLQSSFPEFRTFIKNNLGRFVSFDQSAYQKFYAGQWKTLKPELNWRPYWGFNKKARIVHWHGPKPPFVRRVQQGTEVPGYDIWRGLYDRAPDSYARYLSIWDDYAARPMDAAACPVVTGPATRPARTRHSSETAVTVLHLITGLETGGAERMLLHLVSRADRARLRPLVVSMTGPGTMGPLIERAGVPLRSLGMRRGVPDPRGVARLARILREFRPAVLQTWLYHADLLGLIVRRLGLVPHLVWGLQGTETIDTRVVRRLLARFSAGPDAVVTVSRVGQRFHEGIGYHPRRWVHLPNAFDTSALRPDAEARRQGRAALGIAEDRVAILLPARYHPMKDHGNFLAAAARSTPAHPEALFVLAGAGTEAANLALTGMIEAHGLRDRVLRLGERRDLERLYPAFDIVTLSSAFGEALPMVLGEAMSCGIPCVATDSGDTALVIGDTGVVVPPRDPAALAAGWEQLLALGPVGRQALGERARARIVEHYDLDRVVPRYTALYEEIAAGG
jgi:glycosyltransferase involved in cell wall biosynthesis